MLNPRQFLDHVVRLPSRTTLHDAVLARAFDQLLRLKASHQLTLRLFLRYHWSQVRLTSLISSNSNPS